MGSAIVFTAARMQAIEDASIVSGEVIGDDLYLENNAGATFNAGNVRGPAGIGTTPDGPAGGALSGTYPDPDLADDSVTAAKILDGTITLSELSAALQQLLVPTGVILPYASATPPDGYLLCGPTAVSRGGANAALFAKIGTTFGAGDGSTTFNLPNPQDRVFMGASGAKALASIGGAETMTLLSANLPAHTHTMNHTHQIAARNAATGFGGSPTVGTPSATGTLTEISSLGSSATNTGNGPGSSTAFSLLNPYLAMHFIIKL